MFLPQGDTLENLVINIGFKQKNVYSWNDSPYN